MKHFTLSIVIPTWNRKEKLLKLIKLLIFLLNKNKILFEILVCDSNSSDGTKKELNKRFNKKSLVHVLNIKENSISKKRNIGMKYAKYNNILLLDDDCFPIGNFFKILSHYLGQNSTNKVFCGQYFTQKKLINNSNYYKFRDDKNLKTKIAKKINYKNIITGCCFFNKKKISKDYFFNEKIKGYGLEDIDWANKLFKKKNQLILTEAKVDHQETSRNLGPYLMKWYILSRDAMPSLLKIKKARHRGKIFYFEDIYNYKVFNIIFDMFIRILVFPISVLLKYYLINVDSKRTLYSKTLYKLSVIMYYLRGASDRRKKLFKNSKWYQSGYK